MRVLYTDETFEAYLLISVNEYDTQVSGNKSTAATHVDVISLRNVIYMHWNGRICTDTVFLH